MKVLIVSPYYNNSHFIPIQLRSFQKYLKGCEWKLLVIDDSNLDTLNFLTKEKENVKGVCKQYPEHVIYEKYPHKHSINEGPYRHRDALNFMMSELTLKYKNQFDYLASFDADMCLIKEFNAEKELTGYDIIGPKRIQSLSREQLEPQYSVFSYFFVHCCFFNLKMENIHTMSMSGIPNTYCDTGSMMIKFMRKYPNLKLKYYEFNSGQEGLPEFNGFEFLNRNTFFHFLCGSEWQGPGFRKNTYATDVELFKQAIEKGLTPDDEEKIEESRFRKYCTRYVKCFSNRKSINEEFIMYGL